MIEYLAFKGQEAINKLPSYFSNFAGEFIKGVVAPTVGACALQFTKDPMISLACFSVTSSMVNYVIDNNITDINVEHIKTICSESLSNIDIDKLKDQLTKKGITSKDEIEVFVDTIECYKRGQIDFEKDVFAKFDNLENDIILNTKNIEKMFAVLDKVNGYDGIVALLEMRINDIDNRVKSLENFHSIIENVRDTSKFRTGNNTEFYNYKNRIVSFVGREFEFEQLIGFIFKGAGTKTFGWYSVKGAGGIGKSRLVLELCFHLINVYDWDAGFYNYKQDIGIALNWVPQKPTLIVIDYMSSQPEAYGEIICSLAKRSDEFSYPVRVIGIDRESGKKSLDEMYKYTNPDLLNFFDCGAMSLDFLDKESLWEIFTSICKELNKEITISKLDFINSLSESSALGKPLFAIIGALSYTMNSELSLSYREIIDGGINEYERVWHKYSCSENDKNLIAIATLTQGIDLNIENTAKNSICCKMFCQCLQKCIGYTDFFANKISFFPPDSEETIKRHQFFVERSEDDLLMPLEPDILGEAYVLKIFSIRHKRYKDAILSLAWKVNPLGVGTFLCRLIQDFLRNQNHADKDIIFELMSPPSDEQALECWKQYTPRIQGALYSTNLLDFMLEFNSIVRTNLSDCLSDERILSRSNTGLIAIYCSTNKIAKAVALYTESCAIIQKYSDRELFALHCQNAANISYSYWRNDRTNDILTLYEEVKLIVGKNKYEELYFWLIVIVYNYSHGCMQFNYSDKLINSQNDILDLSFFDGLGDKYSKRIIKYRLIIEMEQLRYFVSDDNFDQARKRYNFLIVNREYKDNNALSSLFHDFNGSSLLDIKSEVLCDFAKLLVINRKLNMLIDIIDELKLISDINSNYNMVHELILQCKNISKQSNYANINRYLVSEERKLYKAYKTIDFMPKSIEENIKSIEKQMQASSIEEMIEEFFANQFRKKMHGEGTRFKQPEFVTKSKKNGDILRAIKKNPNKYKGQINEKVLTKIVNTNLHGSLGEVNEFYDSICSKLPKNL